MAATDTEVDPYGLSTGLIDDFDGTIQDASFGVDDSYAAGAVVLLLDVTTPDPERPIETLKVSCGTGWEVENGGRSITKVAGKMQFNNRSRAGLLLSAALATEAGAVMRAKGTPFEAATWQGLSFHWLRKDVEGMNGEMKSVLLPTKFLGGAGAASSSSAQGDSDLSPALKAKLTAAAKSSATFADFIDAAFAIDGVAGNAAAEAVAADEAFFNAAKG